MIEPSIDNDKTNPPLVIADGSKRFFFFTYSYWCSKNIGKGNLTLTSTGFPPHKMVKQQALEQVKNKYDEPDWRISIVI